PAPVWVGRVISVGWSFAVGTRAHMPGVSEPAFRVDGCTGEEESAAARGDLMVRRLSRDRPAGLRRSGGVGRATGASAQPRTGAASPAMTGSALIYLDSSHPASPICH